jgi:glycosyltransferase involved in cell wall biosynthesis
VGGNRELVERSGAGFVAETPEDWESTLRLLAADPALRLELGRRGRSFVEGYADLDNQAQILTELLLP